MAKQKSRNRKVTVINPSQPQGVQRVVAKHYSGPLPQPDDMIRYGEAHPDGPKIIFEEFQKQGEHRRNRETDIVTNAILRANRGQTMAFVLFSACLIFGFILVLMGKDIQGFSTIIGSAAIIASMFIYSKIDGKKKNKSPEGE